MKKKRSLLLKISVLAVGCLAVAGILWFALNKGENDALASAFEQDTLTLVRVEEPQLTLQDFELPDALWAAQGVEKPEPETLEQMIPATPVTTLSRSPSGNSGIVSLQGAEGGMIVSYYNGKYHFTYPSQTRGVPDQYGNLARCNRMGIRRLLGEEDMVYSHDGRYAVICNIKIAISNMQFFLDPILLDLSTGEMILTATYKSELSDENIGAVTTACFSSDDRYFYYILFGTTAEFRTPLYRYDLSADVTELCYSGFDSTYYPSLSETADGRLLILQDTAERTEPMGVVCMWQTKEGWTGEERPVDLPMRYWQSNRLMYSPKSGYAVAPGRTIMMGGAFYSLLAFEPSDASNRLNQFIVISKTDDKAVKVSSEEILMTLDSLDPSSDIPTAFPYHIILCARLSPDGRYVLLHTVNNGTAEDSDATNHLFMLRLEDLAIREVNGIASDSLKAGAQSNEYMPMIEWNTDTLIISTADGIHSYRFR